MPADLNKLNESKQRILNFIKTNGPSLPVHIAREISSSPIFAAAFLSELYAEGRIRISNMRVGSSPLYYLPGQENLLENFLNYLNQKEKEALSILKNYKILEDEKQEPAIRVALRSVKDFAIPLKVQSNNEIKIIWKYFLFQDEEIKSLVQEKISPKRTEQQVQVQKPLVQQPIQEIKTKEQEKQIQKEETPISQPQEIIIKEKPKRKPKLIDNEFPRKVKEYLASKNVEIIEIKEEKKKDFSAKIRIDTLFGKQEYYLVAKDKKKLSDLDLILAHQKAQQDKVPALLLAPGDLDKKALEHHSSWKNLVKFEKLKL